MWNHRIARVLVLGEIDRVTEFEKGMPGAEAEVNGEWVKDPFPDDRGVALKVKNKGLVVVGGCGSRISRASKKWIPCFSYTSIL